MDACRDGMDAFLPVSHFPACIRSVATELLDVEGLVRDERYGTLSVSDFLAFIRSVATELLDVEGLETLFASKRVRAEHTHAVSVFLSFSEGLETLLASKRVLECVSRVRILPLGLQAGT